MVIGCIIANLSYSCLINIWLEALNWWVIISITIYNALCVWYISGLVNTISVFIITSPAITLVEVIEFRAGFPQVSGKKVPRLFPRLLLFFRDFSNPQVHVFYMSFKFTYVVVQSNAMNFSRAQFSQNKTLIKPSLKYAVIYYCAKLKFATSLHGNRIKNKTKNYFHYKVPWLFPDFSIS